MIGDDVTNDVTMTSPLNGRMFYFLCTMIVQYECCVKDRSALLPSLAIRLVPNASLRKPRWSLVPKPCPLQIQYFEAENQLLSLSQHCRLRVASRGLVARAGLKPIQQPVHFQPVKIALLSHSAASCPASPSLSTMEEIEAPTVQVAEPFKMQAAAAPTAEVAETPNMEDVEAPLSDSDNSESAADEKLASARAAVAATPSYENHLSLTALLRSEDLSALRAARDAFADAFALPPPVWLAFLNDELRVATSGPERAAIADALIPRALGDYASIDVSLAAVRFQGEERLCRGEISEADFEKWFVQHCGVMGSGGFPVCVSVMSRVFKSGAALWEAYREQLVNASAEDVTVERSVRLEAKNCWGTGFVSAEDDVSSPVSGETEETMRVLGVFEEKLVKAGSVPSEFSGTRTPELVAQYAAYAASEEARDRTAAVVVWERCVAECFLHSEAWEAFAEFAKRFSDGLGLAAQGYSHYVYSRFVRNVPWYLPAWTGLLSSAGPLDEEKRQALVESVIARVTTVVMQSEDIRGAERLSSAIVILCQEQSLKELRDAARKFNIDGSQGWASVSTLAASLDNDVEARTAVMEEVVGKLGSEARWWTKYAQLMTHNNALAQSIYKRGLAAVGSAEQAQSLADAWIFFEGQHASASESGKFLEVEAMANSRVASLSGLAGSGSGGAGKSPIRRKRAPPPLTKSRRKRGPATQQPTQATGGSKGDGPKATKKNGGSGPVPMLTDDGESKVAPLGKPAGSGTSKPTSVYEPNTVYVNNLEYSITADKLREAFQSAGSITDVRLPMRRDGAVKGFAYVEFEEETAVQAALAMDKMKISGREVWVKRSKPPKPKPTPRPKPPPSGRGRPQLSLSTGTDGSDDAKMTEASAGDAASPSAVAPVAPEQVDKPRDQNDFRAMLGLTKK